MTIKRVTFLQELLAFMGLEDRLHLEWISSAEAQKFVRVITDFTEKIRSLGPNPLVGMNSSAALWKPGAAPLDVEALLQNDEPLQPDSAAGAKEEAAHAKASETVA
jgi:F420-non-reducing hydrogenase iron-sulfur subunit